MRRFLSLLLITMFFGMIVPVVSADDAFKCPQGDAAGRPQVEGEIADQAQACRVDFCGIMYQKRIQYEEQLRRYPTALDAPFEELFLSLKTSVENYDFDLRNICGTQAQPLPVCAAKGYNLGDSSSTVFNDCSTAVQSLVDTADTVVHEMLLQLAGNQRVHTYARRLDALAREFKKVNEVLALVVTYINKIRLPSVVGTPQNL